MKKIFIFLLLFSLTFAVSECFMNSDCSSGNICFEGSCIEVAVSPSESSLEIEKPDSVYLQCGGEISTTFIDNITDIMGAVILLNILLISFAYMFGKAFSNARFLVFSKDELFHLFFSAMLVLSLFGIISISCFTGEYFETILFAGAPPEYYHQDMDMTDIAINYLSKVKLDAKSLVNTYTQRSIVNEMFASWAYTIYTFMGNTVTTGTEAYKRTYALQYDSLISMVLSPILISISLQELFLKFMLDFSIPIIFPMGLLLRIFSPTRSLGNMIIAFAIGSYVFLPLMYGFNASMYLSTMSEDDCLEFSEAIDDQILGDCYDKGNFWSIAKMIPQAFFLPNLTLAVFITFLSAVNKALRVIG